MIKVLLVDDSALVRAMLKSCMRNDKRLNVVGEAENGEVAIQKSKSLEPDLIVMDINMPVMDGITATKKILEQQSTAIVSFSTEDTATYGYKCLEAGALELIRKPDFSTIDSKFLQTFCDRLVEIAEKHKRGVVLSNTSEQLQMAIKASEESHKEFVSKESAETADEVVSGGSNMFDVLVVGASTGGPIALQKMLGGIKKDFPLPIVITQHIDETFDVQFAQWLSNTSGIPVEMARDRMIAQRGKAYLAPAGKHLCIKRSASGDRNVQLCLDDSAPVHFLKPCVDKLFESAAANFGERVLAVILTGMGRDGADGMKTIKAVGGYTVAQDEASCVVYGMPKAAIDEGAVKNVLPLSEIAKFLNNIA